MSQQPVFWSDQLAFGVENKFKDEDVYVCASGISPSGTVHIGNFREIITSDFVVKSLKQRGNKTRFIYSWDDYDRFRKVPENVPDEWEKHLGKPLSEVPDPSGEHDSYADYFIEKLEKELEDMHMDIEFIRQSKMFENCEYSDLMKQAMQRRDKVRDILNKYRTEPLKQDYYPIRIYCEECGKDFTEVKSYDGEYTVTYECQECGDEKELNFNVKGLAKPPWRLDWPMRWHYENVHFEPGGKDHSSAGSSRDTGVDLIEEIYNDDPPIYQMYDFVKPKGSDKKISSSSGENTLTLADMKDVYTPEMVRFLFSESKPNSPLTLSFDEDIFPRYDKFDEIEEAYFNPESIDNERKKEHWQRVYELAMVDVPEEQPVRIPFKHASFVAQTVPENEWRTKAINSLQNTGHISQSITSKQKEYVLNRLRKAYNWARNYATDEYKYKINFEPGEELKQKLNSNEVEAISLLENELEKRNFNDKEELDSIIFNVKDKSELSAGDFFSTIYRVLLNREQGPRLSTLILSIGVEDSKDILSELK